MIKCMFYRSSHNKYPCDTVVVLMKREQKKLEI
jgi:hypothetical protein